MVHPSTQNNIEQFRLLHRKLKDVKEYYPSALRDLQKQCFVKCIEECLEVAEKYKNVKVV